MEEGLLPTNGSAFDLTSTLLPQLRPSLPSSSSLIGTSLEEESWEMKRGRGGGSPTYTLFFSFCAAQSNQTQAESAMHAYNPRQMGGKQGKSFLQILKKRIHDGSEEICGSLLFYSPFFRDPFFDALADKRNRKIVIRPICRNWILPPSPSSLHSFFLSLETPFPSIGECPFIVFGNKAWE